VDRGEFFRESGEPPTAADPNFHGPSLGRAVPGRADTSRRGRRC
jgi:hypothetical protein